MLVITQNSIDFFFTLTVSKHLKLNLNSDTLNILAKHFGVFNSRISPSGVGLHHSQWVFHHKVCNELVWNI